MTDAPEVPQPVDQNLDPARPTAEELRLKLFGARRLALGTAPNDRRLDVVGTALLTVFAAVLRLVRLGTPNTLVFDETFYVKDAWTLWRLGFEAKWPELPNPAFEAGQVFTYLDEAAYVVHPQVGKWLIGLGMELGGGTTHPFAWRLGNAIVGILAVLLIIRVARRLFASTALGLVAGGLMAIDGTSIVHSRTALLDNHLMIFVLLAFYFLLLDRDWSRGRLAERTGALYAALGDPGGSSLDVAAGLSTATPVGLNFGPKLGFRYWRLAAGISLGLAVGVKWSGLYFIAAFGLLTVLWDLTARRAVGIKKWISDGVFLDGLGAFFAIVPVALAVYVASWWSWFITPGAWGRDWAANNPGEGITWLPEILRSFVRYHEQMWGFHTGLVTEHAYQANPIGFIVQWRPTSFYWNAGEGHTSAVTSLGNPLLWWLAAAAGIFAIVWGVHKRDWRALAVLSGTLAGWLPWVLTYAETARTMFTFYTIVFTPWVVLTLVYVFAVLLESTAAKQPITATDVRQITPVVNDNIGQADPEFEAVETLPTRPGEPESGGRRRTLVVCLVTVTLALIGLVSGLFYPLWTAIEVPMDYWRFLIRFRNWI